MQALAVVRVAHQGLDDEVVVLVEVAQVQAAFVQHADVDRAAVQPDADQGGWLDVDPGRLSVEAVELDRCCATRTRCHLESGRARRRTT